MQLIVHGGAGETPDEPDRRQAVLDDAVAVGAEEASPVQAVVAAVGVLESSPRFNAGVGGAVQSDGMVRTDAGLMTHDRRVGAVCSMPGVEHAARVARVVMDETPHVFVSGKHAVALAEEFGVGIDVDLTTDRTRERWVDADPPADPRDHLDWVREQYGGSDTVGAVAV
ncbi:isoaspartyl peptidase/L-asparaginase, partial [Halococcus hamelinensis]